MLRLYKLLDWPGGEPNGPVEKVNLAKQTVLDNPELHGFRFNKTNTWMGDGGVMFYGRGILGGDSNINN